MQLTWCSFPLLFSMLKYIPGGTGWWALVIWLGVWLFGTFVCMPALKFLQTIQLRSHEHWKFPWACYLEVISSACWNVCFYSLKSRQGGCECWVFKGRGGLGPVYMNPGWRVGSPSRVHPFRVKNPVSCKPPLVVLEVSLMNSSHTSCLMLRTVIPCASLTNIVSLAHSKHERSCASASTCLKAVLN